MDSNFLCYFIGGPSGKSGDDYLAELKESVKELNLECSLELDHIIDDNGKKYGYYKSLEDHEINQITEKDYV